jgi:hypothetical protein
VSFHYFTESSFVEKNDGKFLGRHHRVPPQWSAPETAATTLAGIVAAISSEITPTPLGLRETKPMASALKK